MAVHLVALELAAEPVGQRLVFALRLLRWLLLGLGHSKLLGRLW